jgi:hypothetical protein
LVVVPLNNIRFLVAVFARGHSGFSVDGKSNRDRTFDPTRDQLSKSAASGINLVFVFSIRERFVLV